MEQVEGQCEQDIIQTIAATLARHLSPDDRVLFDDLRVAARVHSASHQQTGDALEVMLDAGAVKTPAELATLREAGASPTRSGLYRLTAQRWQELVRGRKAVAHFMIDHDVDPLPEAPCCSAAPMIWFFARTCSAHPSVVPLRAVKSPSLKPRALQNFWIDINRTAHIGPASSVHKEQYAAVRETFEAISARLRVRIPQRSATSMASPQQPAGPARKIAGCGALGRACAPRKPECPTRARVYTARKRALSPRRAWSLALIACTSAASSAHHIWRTCLSSPRTVPSHFISSRWIFPRQSKQKAPR